MKNAQDWWSLYLANVKNVKSIAFRVGSDDFDPWADLIEMDADSLYKKLDRIWFDAPDDKVIHSWQGWGSLCDLLSERWACDVEPICEIEAVQVKGNFTEVHAWHDALRIARPFLDAGGIVAGGFIRDILAGDEPRDIDVYCDADVFETLCIKHGASDFFTEPDENYDLLVFSFVHFDRRVQLIRVDGDRLGYIRAFDAIANMVYATSEGIFSIGSEPIQNIDDRLYFRNPLSATPDHKFAEREEKMRGRGWEVERAPDPVLVVPWAEGNDHDFFKGSFTD